MIRRLREWSSWFDQGGKDPTWYFRWVSSVVGHILFVLACGKCVIYFDHRSYLQRISPLCSNHCWVAYDLNNCEERLLIQTLPRFWIQHYLHNLLYNIHHNNVHCLKQQRFCDKSEWSSEAACKPRPRPLPWGNFCQWLGNHNDHQHCHRNQHNHKHNHNDHHHNANHGDQVLAHGEPLTGQEVGHALASPTLAQVIEHSPIIKSPSSPSFW